MPEAKQYGPWPSELAELVDQIVYRDGWYFDLDDKIRDPASTHGVMAGGLTFTIMTKTANSYHPNRCESCRSTVSDYRVSHLFPVPAATWDRDSWLNWIMDCIEQVELHEAREFFQIKHPVYSGAYDGDVAERPFAPNHGPGRDPYRRYSYASDEDARTSFRGVVND